MLVKIGMTGCHLYRGGCLVGLVGALFDGIRDVINPQEAGGRRVADTTAVGRNLDRGPNTRISLKRPGRSR